ncbi:MAG TPA: propionyl-CoA--succinate CoA transferase, partial [Patescibacteria group bacterium]|nr:propionyl-CoA--succinate CoA transferase [Patescibacteria group bacterium]
MSAPSRVLHSGLRQKIMSADAAAALIQHGDNVGMSGFTGSGYPKAIPPALAKHIERGNQNGETFRIG